SGLRGGAAAGVVTTTGLTVAASAEPVAPVERTEFPAAVERSRTAVGLVPGAVSESGGARPMPVGGAPGRRAVRRLGPMLRRMLVETKPVRLAPEPAGFPNCGSSLDSGL